MVLQNQTIWSDMVLKRSKEVYVPSPLQKASHFKKALVQDGWEQLYVTGADSLPISELFRSAQGLRYQASFTNRAILSNPFSICSVEQA